MVQVVRSGRFDDWLKGLRDLRGKAIMLVRIERLRKGNPGDARPVGGGVSEMRIAHGPGYRVYYKTIGSTLILVLAGGDKSTQDRDIVETRVIAQEWS